MNWRSFVAAQHLGRHSQDGLCLAVNSHERATSRMLPRPSPQICYAASSTPAASTTILALDNTCGKRHPTGTVLRPPHSTPCRLTQDGPEAASMHPEAASMHLATSQWSIALALVHAPSHPLLRPRLQSTSSCSERPTRSPV